MKVLIVDDEPLARTRLIRLLNDMDEIETAGEAGTGCEAIELTDTLNPDVVLLDIRMPEMDGLEAAMHLSQLDNPPAIIFTTAYNEHALAAFEANAVDYLLKPIRRERLANALTRARRINRAQLLDIGQQEGGEKNAHARTHISANISGNLQLVSVADIIYFQAEQKYVTVRHLGGQLLIDDPLKSLEMEFSDRFLRVHRNSLVAMQSVQGLERIPGGRYEIYFHVIDDRLEVSRRLATTVRKRLKGLGTN
ncbi:MAG TPA: response regulator transcription factor [Gammaproteobacteria bacterium]|nr:response regulator transcription factor [Gammaproteobacteria bacterium]